MRLIARPAALLVAGLAGCAWISDADVAARRDFDQDGFVGRNFGGDDCVDDDPTAHPGAEEIWYNGVDEDCDGNDADRDGDGWDVAVDCDDGDPAVAPDATEVWYDGLDQDCSGGDDFDADGDGDRGGPDGDDCDDDDPRVGPSAAEVWYDGFDQDCDGADDFDQDGDGFRAERQGGRDCDDTDPAIHPNATENPATTQIDEDCDGNPLL